MLVLSLEVDSRRWSSSLSMTILGHRALRFLDDLPKNATDLEVASLLRKTLSIEQALAASEQYFLRRRALSQRGDDRFLLLTRKGLEQATHPMVAAWRARELSRTPARGPFWDATCGLGADSLALLDQGQSLISSDLDPRTVACAAHNLNEVASPGARSLVLRCDATERAVRPAGVLIDPDRRKNNRRSLDPSIWSPSMEKCLEVLKQAEMGCLKLPPSLTPTENLLSLGTLCWVSFERELKEVALFSGLAAWDGPPRRVVALTGAAGEEVLEGEPIRMAPMDPKHVQSVDWLANPDPALLRSGLLELEASRHGLRPLAPQLAWVGGEEQPSSPFFKCKRVLASTRADPRRVRRMLADHDVGPLDIWKRGHPDSAEVLARRFKGRGSRRAILAIGRLEEGHQAWLLDPESGAAH